MSAFKQTAVVDQSLFLKLALNFMAH